MLNNFRDFFMSICILFLESLGNIEIFLKEMVCVLLNFQIIIMYIGVSF